MVGIGAHMRKRKGGRPLHLQHVLGEVASGSNKTIQRSFKVDAFAGYMVVVCSYSFSSLSFGGRQIQKHVENKHIPHISTRQHG